jgi:phosphatidylglycerophosphate synthase
MVDIQTISIAIASAGVFAAAIYYILQIRHQNRMRKTDLLMRLHLAFSTKETVEACLKYLSTEYKDYDDFVEKYGSPIAEGQVQTVFVMMAMFFEGIGVLLKNKLLDLNLVTELFAVEMFWLKLKPLAEGMRKQLNNPEIYTMFEYLYNEMKKREQQLARAK